MENMNLHKYLQFDNNISKLLPNKSLPQQKLRKPKNSSKTSENTLKILKLSFMSKVYKYLPLISTSIIQPRVPKKLTSTSPKTSKKCSKTSETIQQIPKLISASKVFMCHNNLTSSSGTIFLKKLARTLPSMKALE